MIPSPKFKVGDEVWLSSKHIKSQRPTGKLDYKRLGPFAIIETIGTRAYKLALPHNMRVHPVFHASLLEPFKEDQIAGRQAKELPPIVVDEHEEYEVKKLLIQKFVMVTYST